MSYSENRKLTKAQIDSIRRNPELKRELVSMFSLAPRLLRKGIDKMSQDELGELEDAALDAMKSCAPTVHSFSAEGSFGSYPIDIRGVQGAYFYAAPEFDDSGYFSTLDEAITAVWGDHGGCNLRDEGPVPPVK